MPGTLVAIGLSSLVLLAGLGSKVSIWLGPPVMNSRMQLLCFGLLPADWSAARAARISSQPETGAVRMPAADSLSRSRREREEENMVFFSLDGFGELGGVSPRSLDCSQAGING